MNSDRHHKAVTARIRTHAGRASHYCCVLCSRGASDWVYDGSGTAELRDEKDRPYSSDESAYAPLCRACSKQVTMTRAKSLECRQSAVQRIEDDIQRRILPAEQAATLARSAARVREAYRAYRNGNVSEYLPRQVSVADLLMVL